MAATGVQQGDNLILLNKYQMYHSRIAGMRCPMWRLKIPGCNRKLPDTLLIRDCGGVPGVLWLWSQDGSAWLVSPGGKIVDQQAAAAPTAIRSSTAAELLAPSVGTQMVLDDGVGNPAARGCWSLLAALEETRECWVQVDAIHLGR